MERPVFYDPSGKRRRWSKRVLWALILVLTGAALAFGATIVNVPAPDPLKIGFEREQPRALGGQIAHIRRTVGRNVRKLTAWMPGGKVAARPQGRQLVAAFYVPWDDASRATLHAHADEIDWVVAAMGFVTGPNHDLNYEPNALANRNLRAELAIAQRKPRLMVMIQNAKGGQWDSAGLTALLRDPKARGHLLDQVAQILGKEGARGVTFDFEELPAKAQPYYRRFIAEAHARFAPKNWLVTLAVPADDDDWNLKAYAKLADRIFLMIYDEHSNESDPGPIASQPWFVQRLRATVADVGADKAIVAFGNYAYDWMEGGGPAESITVEDAWLTAHDSGAKTRFDPASGNATYDYKDDDGDVHHVWMLDAASSWNQLRAAKAMGVFGVALWRMGGDDPGTWQALSALRTGNTPPAFGKISSLSNTNVEGFGEIIRIDTTPTEGFRTATRDERGLIRDEQYQSYPTPYVVNRTGMSKTKVALTFDDGPDGTWTPKILDILEAKHAPATFFVIGENALAHPLLLKRILDDGSEIGNHSYTHPNMALVSDRGQHIELNTTQRLVQAYTGRSMRLFRAPYFGDAEPTTEDELGPILLAQRAGYVSVGLHADSEDWTRPGVQAIVDNVINAVVNGHQAIEDEDYQHSANIVLLHDSGGDRAQTVAALPAIIDGLRARGFELVPVSALAGLTPQEVNRPISGHDLIAVRFDIGIFLVLAGLNALLKFLFFIAIFLGMARAVLLAVLAVRSNLKRNRPVPPAIDPTRFVSVLIPAFNEARVIEESVKRVLASTEIGLEVIVIDDGSKDETSAIVALAFDGDPRVRLLTLENGGKARALNRGLELAKGEVIVALDADTQFEPETIARLSRWFADPEVGAVAGNAKVGNRVNLVTRWQAVEYVTAQNLERRALSRFDAITVVPGAVGAWRRAALDAVGGYPHDTLAEDQDLTIAIQRAGWLVEYDVDAVAWTESPESFGALAKQRFRWAFGTLQCLWKHRSILRTRHPTGLALVGIPQAWLFQIGFALISPLIDLALAVSIVATIIRVDQHGWAQTHTDVIRMAIYWIGFTAIDAICGWVAYKLEPREKHYPLFLLLAQRFIYRQIMYSVVLRAVNAAIRGPWVGWGKLERSGSVGKPAA
ncbi:cellulose synthase/poly-beta-1,6-N-acetylglucosamine synthase-like glycosyltransferase/peptidoglycan/xylan/chitin deacetylase (PgdA/CDA1 family)/spore germination protein YaaH [Sphingomonas vulcanisoli]|uniref:Chitooligosaccharide deacetylase n=1 Tax=Sphingomonas vulcanisoli TaxID=1658060 RepID=A0ABX0TWC8_9SPHN|nr:glycosyltransferase [Sphingomonas vulcanisoli]NIJ08685.1 cellulose synthase/poly-beta-1,6-N-acetylglucosamine synthase-like glycosyltransferase/peptidoglycan/xylan/chitin deacetylase (PgdA/CDA1 family)/spore germination protein YaaH [Sphingomonas vulcanisoli]